MSGNRTLRNFRLACQLTQGAFADRAGISRAYLSQIENGRFALGHRAGLRICDAFRAELAKARLSLEDLVRDSKPRP